jgi:crotonobetainyl-CoA:carnitine CoA-transferase CaiB-like acyl-CoA transferase
MNHASQLQDDPHVRARGTLVESAGTPVPASPIRVIAPDGRQTTTSTTAPHSVGQDTHDVLTQSGFSQAEIAALTAQGVI